MNQVLTSYRITQNLATAETPFFLVYGRDPNLPLHQLFEPMQHFLGDPDSGMLKLETHRLALAIAKKTLDENRFKTAQKTMAQKPSLQSRRSYIIQEQAVWQMRLTMEAQI